MICKTTFAQNAACPTPIHTTFISAPSKAGSLQTQQAANDQVAQQIIAAVAIPSSVVYLAADADIDFSRINSAGGTDSPILLLANCVTLASYRRVTQSVLGHAVAARVLPPSGITLGDQIIPGGGRTPSQWGPALRWAPCTSNCANTLARNSGAAFIGAGCTVNPADSTSNGGVKILGIRVVGPDPNNHFTSEKGIFVVGCHDFELANSEVYGWGGQAVRVDDCQDNCKDLPIPTSEPPVLYVRIHDNYIHHNQHSNKDQNSEGYGVEVGPGAFAEIYQNVFDYNKHSVMADGHSGGYNAVRNLILKGGGLQESFAEQWIHVFDVHGTANCPDTLVTEHLLNCGEGGYKFVYEENAFQYVKAEDIKIRGTPKRDAIIARNIFARDSQGDAIATGFDVHNVNVAGNNQFNVDTFGQYGVCDIDGDGIDDLILMTGVTWWYSSAGRFPWSFLKADTTVLKDVQLGDVDHDGKCDVVKDDGNGLWLVSKGAKSDWQLLGDFKAPLAQTHLAQFDPNAPSSSRGIRPLTHAFWRTDSGEWKVTALNDPGGWFHVQSSSLPFSALRFGDFTGDGVTDVLANENSHWSISASARSGWTTLNTRLNDSVSDGGIYIANTDAGDNIDDVYRLDIAWFFSPATNPPIAQGAEVQYKWQRSADGVTPWRPFKEFDYVLLPIGAAGEVVKLDHGYVGKFGGGQPGDAIMVIDFNRIGHFYSPAQGKGRDEWSSSFAY
jgi:hypothetical protein